MNIDFVLQQLFEKNKRIFKETSNPVYVKGYEAGRQSSAKLLAAYMDDRMNTLTEIEGIGDKTALKVYQHFMGVLEDEGNSDKYLKAN